MTQETNDEIVEQIKAIVELLLQIDLKDLEAYVQQNGEAIRDTLSFMPMLDPTGYIKASKNGSLENIQLQQKMGLELLMARRTIEDFDPSVKMQILMGEEGFKLFVEQVEAQDINLEDIAKTLGAKDETDATS